VTSSEGLTEPYGFVRIDPYFPIFGVIKESTNFTKKWFYFIKQTLMDDVGRHER
jgi:hypothetical protein